MILVTGPTGSGKTVSLYTGLNILNTEDSNISTAEDPVEIMLPGINQVNINPKVGLTFAGALRAFLRQDPDIIMVGEIRDLETAEIALKAAQTGHLVLSTLHTNDAPKTLTRLVDMGVKPYAIATSVSLIIAQRLARRLCSNCKTRVDVPDEALLKEGFTPEEIANGLQIFGPVGCTQCTDGYKGRTGIYEVMPVSEEIGRIIMEGGNVMQIKEQAAARGRLGPAPVRPQEGRGRHHEPRRDQPRHGRLRRRRTAGREATWLRSLQASSSRSCGKARTSKGNRIKGRGLAKNELEMRARPASAGHRRDQGQARNASSSRATARSPPKTSRSSAASWPRCSPRASRWCRPSRSSASATTSPPMQKLVLVDQVRHRDRQRAERGAGQAPALLRRPVREPGRGRRACRRARDGAREDRDLQGKDRGAEEEDQEGAVLPGRGAGGRGDRDGDPADLRDPAVREPVQGLRRGPAGVHADGHRHVALDAGEGLAPVDRRWSARCLRSRISTSARGRCASSSTGCRCRCRSSARS